MFFSLFWFFFSLFKDDSIRRYFILIFYFWKKKFLFRFTEINKKVFNFMLRKNQWNFNSFFKFKHENVKLATRNLNLLWRNNNEVFSPLKLSLFFKILFISFFSCFTFQFDRKITPWKIMNFHVYWKSFNEAHEVAYPQSIHNEKFEGNLSRKRAFVSI